MLTPKFVSALALAAAIAPAFAQSPVEQQQQALEQSHKMIYFGEGDVDSTSQASLISRFYMDQFRHSQDPRAPYFMLMSRNGKMAMGIGGTVSIIGDYDWDGSIQGPGFAPYDISIPVVPADRTLFQTSVGYSNLFFSVFGTDNRFGDYKLYIEANFNGGSSNNFKLKKAYVTVGDLTLGYAKSTYSDPASQPATIDTQGPNSAVGGTRMLLRYMHDFSKNLSVAVSAETPDDQIGSYANCEGGSVYMPNFAAFTQWKWGGGQHIRLSGLVKPMRYRNLVSQRNEYSTGWGLNLSTVFRPVDPLTVYAAVNTGNGIGSLVNDLSCGAIDLLPYSDKQGEMYAPASYGWYAALQYNYSPNVFSTLIFSQERMLAKHNTLDGASDYKYGLYGTANVFWNITPRWQVGAEFNIGKRCNIDGSNRLAYRTALLAQFSF